MQNGIKPGVYLDWPSAQAQIRGVSNPRHKKFNTRAEAEAFVAQGKHPAARPAPSSAAEDIHHVIIKNSAPGLQPIGPYQPRDKHGEVYNYGTGPLPPGAEDSFDPNIRLDGSGKIVAKTEAERNKTKTISREKNPLGMLRIYTDGSSLRNGTAGARAGVGVFFGPQNPQYGPFHDHEDCASSPLPLQTQTVYSIDWVARGAPREQGADSEAETEPQLTNWRYRNVSEALKGKKQTNQRAELTAIQRALDIAPKHRDVTIYTDSKYAIDCVTTWYRNWERNGWVNSKGKTVENQDLVKSCREAIEERELLRGKTYFVWVKGHANDAGNIEADRLANEGARMGRGVEDEDEAAAGGLANGIAATATESTRAPTDNGSAMGNTTGDTSLLPDGAGDEDEDVKRAFDQMQEYFEQDDYP